MNDRLIDNQISPTLHLPLGRRGRGRGRPALSPPHGHALEAFKGKVVDFFGLRLTSISRRRLKTS